MYTLRIALLTSLLLFNYSLPTAAALQNQSLDFSCSTFHAFLAESELVAKYGRENVTNGPIFGADDGPEIGTILFADATDAKVEIMWRDSAARQHPSWVKIQGDASRWRLPNGVGIGDDLRTIERKNGWPFRLAGFFTELHGNLRNWGGGRLETTPNCNAIVTFQPRGTIEDGSSIRQVSRLNDVSSGHPAMQRINPSVVALWIRHPPQQTPPTPDDALLNVLVWGLHMPINPEDYSPELRTELQQYLRRAAAYSPRRTISSAREMRMVHETRIRYETRLIANTDEANAPILAESYVTRLRPCYEWEGFHDCPEREAVFADEYLIANPTGPFTNYLSLLTAHRWLCTAEGYDYEGNPEQAERSRRLYEQRLSVARQSNVLLIRTAADRLAVRGQCLSTN